MRAGFMVAVACLMGSPGMAADLSDDQILVLACLERIEDGTTWGQCVNLMFQPCAGEEVGSEPHVACLNTQREMWSTSAEALQSQVSEAITPEGNTQLAEILGAWTRAIVQNCQEVGQSRAATGAEAARVGCEVSEIIGLTGEFAACLEGRSTAEFCTFKE